MIATLRYTPVEEPPSVILPRSKSMAARAMLASAVAGNFHHEPSDADCDDIRVLGEALSALQRGASEVYVGASGTAMRFLTAYIAATPGLSATLTGTERLCQRPMAPLLTALREMGAEIEPVASADHAPLRIRGKRLAGGDVGIDAALSSQFVSALLLVAPTFTNPLRLHVSNLTTSLAYIDMTIAMMALNPGISISRQGALISVAGEGYSITDYPVEPDWSAATFLYEYEALTGRKIGSIATPQGHHASLQSDSHGADIFRTLLAGADSIDISDNIDMAPALIATIALKGVHCKLTGAANLRHKESDRISAMDEELRKTGCRIAYTKASGGTITISRHAEMPHGATLHISSHADHRIAMAMAMTLPALPGVIMEIAGAESVNKSFPGFWKEISKLGFTVKLL